MGPADTRDNDVEQQRLATLAGRGESEALAALLRALQDTIYRFCRSRLGDESLAGDATQETAVRLVKSIRRFRGESRVTTWALGIAVNVCREMQRAQRTANVEPEWLEQQTDTRATPDSCVATRESVEQMRRLVQQLPARQSEAVTLRYFEQLSVADAAAAMGCSEGTVKAAAWQGLRALRTQLEALR